MALRLSLKAPTIASAGSFILLGGGPVTATITEQGLTNLSLNGTTVLSGTLQAESSGTRFGIADTSLGSIVSRAVKSLSANSAKVIHRHENGTAVFLYTLKGEDLTIAMTVTPSVLVTVLGWTGLVGSWPDWQASVGLMGNTVMLLPTAGLTLFHPSPTTPIGAAYRIPTSGPNANQFGVCVYPINTGLVRTLVYWKNSGGPTAKPTVECFIAPSTFRYPGAMGVSGAAIAATPVFYPGIHPGESYTVTWGIRVSQDTTWTHMLQPYRDQLRTTFGPCTYAASRDDRPIAKSFPGGAEFLQPITNPYGFSTMGETFYRFDQSATPYCDTFLPGLVASGAQGVIFWSLNGWDTRVPGVDGGGINYNCDVEILPTEVEANRPVLLSRLQAGGLAMGREARPSILRTRASWTADRGLAIVGTSGITLDDLLARFDAAIAQGFTHYYFDSFPGDFNDHLLLKALRDHWGSGAPLVYTEAATDVSAVYAGIYVECNVTIQPFRAGSVDASAGLNLPLLPIIRWLVAATSVICNGIGADPWSVPGYLDYLYDQKLTPLIHDQDPMFTPGLPALLATANAAHLVNNQFPKD